MSSQGKTYLKFGAATVVILLLMGYLAYTGVQDSKASRVTVKGKAQDGHDGAYTAESACAWQGNVQPRLRSAHADARAVLC